MLNWPVWKTWVCGTFFQWEPSCDRDTNYLDEDTFEALRQKRKLNLQKKMRQEQDWKQLGHGRWCLFMRLYGNVVVVNYQFNVVSFTIRIYMELFYLSLQMFNVVNIILFLHRYSELTDTKEFFNAAKKSAKMLVHFYRGVTPRCQIVDAHFEKLAPKHLEARFVKIDAEKNPFLVERLGVILLPTIVLIQNGQTDHAIHGFDEFGGTDDFTTKDMEYVLGQHGVISVEIDRSEEIAQRAQRAGLNHIGLSIKNGAYNHELDCSDDDFDLDT